MRAVTKVERTCSPNPLLNSYAINRIKLNLNVSYYSYDILDSLIRKM